jgi:hypothetical protein
MRALSAIAETEKRQRQSKLRGDENDARDPQRAQELRFAKM